MGLVPLPHPSPAAAAAPSEEVGRRWPRGRRPQPGELWLVGAGEERQLALVLGEPEAGHEDQPGLWVDVVAVGEDLAWQTCLEMRLTAGESTLARPLLVEWRSQGSLPLAAFLGPAGWIRRQGWELVTAALGGVWDEARFGAPLSGRDDERLAVLDQRERATRRLAQAAYQLVVSATADRAVAW